MADTFRGLTLRLSADARPLVSAINSVNRSAGQAQKQMNRLGKALELDPYDVKAMASRLDLAGDKAAHSAREVRLLETALKQAAVEWKGLRLSGSGSPKGIAAMAADMREAYAATQRLRAEYNHVDADLAHVYEQLAKAHREQRKMAGEKISFEAALKEVKALSNGLEKSEEKAKAIRKLVFSKAGFQNLGENAFGFSGKAISRANQAWNTLLRLRDEQRKLNADLTAMNKVEGFRAMQSSLVAARAELRGAAAEAARLKSELYAFGGSATVARAVEDVRRLDSAMEKSVANAQEMKDAFKLLPTNIEAAKVKAHALADAEDTVKQKLAAARDALKGIEKAEGFDKVAASTRNAWVEAERAEAKYAKMEEGMRKLDSRADSLKASLKEAMLVGGGKPEAEVARMRAELEKTDAAADRLRAAMNAVEGEMRTANLSKAFAEARTEVVRLEAEVAKLDFQKSLLSKLGGVGQTFRQFGYGLYSTLTPAIMMAGRYAINAANDVDAAYRDMRKTVNGTEEEFEHLKNAAIEFSRSHVTSADQMLEIESIGGQLGIAAGNLEAFAHTVSNLDIATNMDTEDIALDLAKLSNIMHFGQEQYDAFADSLVRLGNNEPALESDIMAISTRFAGMAANVGMTTSDMLGLATAATATGQKAEAAGGSIQRTIARIEAAVASGGDELEGYAAISNMTAEEFARTWGDSGNHGPIRAMQAFIGGLKEIRDNGGSVIEELNGLGITGVRDRQLLSGLTNTTDVLAESVQMADDAWNGLSTTMKDGAVEQAGDAMREAERKSQGFSGALGIMKNNAAALAVEMGDGAAPWITDLGEKFKQLTQIVHEMSPEMKTGLVGAMGALAAVGPAAVGVGTLTSAIGAVGTAFKGGQGKITEYIARLNQMTVSTNAGMRANLGLQKALGVMASGKGVIGIAAAAGVVTYLATSVADSIAKHQQHIDVTEKLGSLMQQTGPKAGALASDLTALGLSASKTAHNFDEVVQANAEMASSIEQRNKSAQTEISTLESARLAIAKYGNANRQLSGSEQGQLIAAIDLVNEKCGTQYQVIDALVGKLGDESGAYLSNKGAIDEYVRNKQRAIQVDALEADYAELAQRRRETYASMLTTDDDAERVKLWQEYQAINSAMEATTKLIGDMSSAADEGGITAGKLVAQTDLWQAAFEGLFNSLGDGTPWKSYQESLVAFGDALDKTGLSVETFAEMGEADMGKMVRTWIESGGDMAATLESVGLTAKTAGEQFSSALSEADGDMGGFERRADELAGGVEDFSRKLMDSGISAQQFAQMGMTGFDNLLAVANGDMEAIGEAIALLNSQGIDPKNLVITGDGLIDTLSGKLYQLDVDANALTDTGRVFRIEEDGSLTEITGELEQIDGVNVEGSIEIDDNAAEAQAEVDEAYADAEEGAEGDIEIEDNADETSEHIEELGKTVDDLPDSKDISVNMSGNAESALQSIIDKLVWIDNNRTHTVTVNKQGDGNFATGAISTRVIRTRIPRNAAGALNGIVARPTLTNIGWTGEAGAEAILHMRNAGGAVIPLSNRRYVRPFARAVASEMGGNQQRAVNVTVNLDYNASADAREMARDFADSVETYLNLGV